jgi:hypothetical protein
MLCYKLDDPNIYPNRKQIKMELEKGKLGDDNQWLAYISRVKISKTMRK